MPEANVNAEIAKHLGEDEHDHAAGKGDGGTWGSRHQRIIEIGEALLLAIVAVATAWSGYQAAKWDGESSRAYAHASAVRLESEQAALESNQVVTYNAITLNSWLEATATGDEPVARIMEKRFTPEYKVAFEAWVELDPLNNPDAPPGPRYMEEYEDPLAEEAAHLSEQADEAFSEGVHTRETGEKYVRATVILAAVLFLIAIGQRFKLKGVRDAVLITAGVFLIYCIVLMTSLPRT